MRNLGFSLVVAIVLLFGMSFATAHAQESSLNEYYPLGENDSWTYATKIISEEETRDTLHTRKVEGIENVDGVDAKRIAYGWSDKDVVETYYIIEDAEGLKISKIIRGNEIEKTFTPPACIFPFNIREKKQFSFDSEFTSKNLDPNNPMVENSKCSVNIYYDGQEDVVVPAGEFLDCMKLTKASTISFLNGKISEIKDITWLAKGVGVVKENVEIIKSFEGVTEIRRNEGYNLVSATINGKGLGE